MCFKSTIAEYEDPLLLLFVIVQCEYVESYYVKHAVWNSILAIVNWTINIE